MYSPGHSGASAYARVGVETGVMGANPNRLIAMYQGARQAIAQARMRFQHKRAWIGMAPKIAKMAAQPSPERIR